MEVAMDECVSGKEGLCVLQRFECELCASCDLHDADRDASMMEETTAPMGCWNVLVVAGSAAEEVAEFVMLAAEPVGCVMLLEAAHTSDPPLDPAMVLFKSIIQINAHPVADVAPQRGANSGIERQTDRLHLQAHQASHVHYTDSAETRTDRLPIRLTGILLAE